MIENNVIIRDIERNPLRWKMECPKCGSFVSAKYALALAPVLGVKILPHWYCHCTRFQVMNLVPSKLSSFQVIVAFYSFINAILAKIINCALRRTNI